MRINEEDLSYLIDIVDCVTGIETFIDGIWLHEFEKDRMRKLAVERLLEIIGQAANNISKETQNAITTIPWRDIVGLRNKLAHDYGEILAERIWMIAKDSIPELKRELEKIGELQEYVKKKQDRPQHE
jgi:uncharacterized protein with HEPN domain